MKLNFLGTGGSWPTKRRGPMSIGLRSGHAAFLIDCGEGTQRQILYSSLSPMKLDAVLITHLHGDHFLGLPGLVQSMSLNDRSRELNLIGPTGIKESWMHALKMCPFTQRFDIVIREVKDGESFDLKGVRISCTSSDHSVDGISYRFDEAPRPGRFDRSKAIEIGLPEGPLWGKVQNGKTVEFERNGTVVKVGPEDLLGPERRGASMIYTGDTRPSEKIIELSRNADILIHEATFTPEHEELAREVGHSTIRDAAYTAQKAKVRKLALVHSSPRYTKEEEFERYRGIAEELYPGVIIPEDLQEMEINP